AAQGLGVDADDRFFQFHNDLVNFAVAGGVVGIICWLLLLAAPLLGTLTRARDSLARARLYCCLVLTLGYAVFGLTDMTIGYDLPTTLYCFLTVAILALFRREPSPPPAPWRSQPCGSGRRSISPPLVASSMARTSSSDRLRLSSTPRLSLSCSSVRMP